MWREDPSDARRADRGLNLSFEVCNLLWPKPSCLQTASKAMIDVKFKVGRRPSGLPGLGLRQRISASADFARKRLENR